MPVNLLCSEKNHEMLKLKYASYFTLFMCNKLGYWSLAIDKILMSQIISDIRNRFRSMSNNQKHTEHLCFVVVSTLFSAKNEIRKNKTYLIDDINIDDFISQFLC